MAKKIINHKWRCECGVGVGEDYDKCPICQIKERIKEIENEKSRIKNECCSCGKKFKNSKKLFNERGNYCSDCSGLCDHKLQWRKKKRKKDYWEGMLDKAAMNGGTIETSSKKVVIIETIEEKIKKVSEELGKLTTIIKKRWGVDMEEDNRKFTGFKNYLWETFGLKD